MKFPIPDYSKDYPIYIVGYWLVSWAILFWALFFLDMNKITPDGKYLINVPCEYSERGGRYDEEEECLEYGEPEYTPLGYELKGRFKRSGIITGIISLLIGGCSMYQKRKQEKEIR